MRLCAYVACVWCVCVCVCSEERFSHISGLLSLGLVRKVCAYMCVYVCVCMFVWCVCGVCVVRVVCVVSVVCTFVCALQKFSLKFPASSLSG